MLLSVRNNKPFKKRGGEEIYYCRDLICLYINPDTLEWELRINNIKKKGNELNSLWDLLDSLILEKRSHHENSDNKEQRKLIIWTDRLHLFYKVILDYYSSNFKVETMNKLIKGRMEKRCWFLYNSDLKFINFNIVCGEKDIFKLKEIYNFSAAGGVDLIYNFVKMQIDSGINLFSIQHPTFGSTNLKKFYKRFNEEELKQLWEENKKNKAIPKSIDIYQILMETEKRGIIKINPKFERKLTHNVYSFDLKSAYVSQFIRGDDFPIGRIKKEKQLELKELIENDRWFIAVFVSKERINIPFVTILKEESRYVYYLYSYIYKYFQLLNIKISEYEWLLKDIYVCEKEGRLNYNARKNMIDIYNEIEEYKVTNPVKAKALKPQKEIIYGKGIQVRNIKSNAELKNYYIGRSDLYILPQFSLHALMRTGYELLLMWSRTGKDDFFVACDTDSIKTLNPNAKEIFEERNCEIMKENAAAGFPDCNIGTWKFEGLYDNFIQFAKKVYAYSCEEELTCKFAGCRKEAWKELFRDKTIEESIELLSKKDFSIPNGIEQYRYDRNNYKIVKEKYNYEPKEL